MRAKFGACDIQIGIEEGPHYVPKRGKPGLKGQDVLDSYAGIKVRQTTNKTRGKISQVAKSFSEFLGFNFFTKPFEKKNDDLIKFTNQFLEWVLNNKGSKQRIVNLLQAIVRNPILRGDYGHNSARTEKIKGFNHLGIDTAQLFRSIKAKVRKGA